MTSPPNRVLLTGVSRGLGRALCHALDAAGHTILGCSRNVLAITELRDTLSARHQFEVVDVAQDAEVAAWAQQAESKSQPPELLVNNAALINRNAPLWKVPAEEFSTVVDVNIKGSANVIRHWLPGMLSAEQGIVVNISSGWGRSASAEVAPYCATKWAIEGMTKALAEELPSGMAAVALNPGIIHTEMLASCFGAGASSFPSPETWASAALPFLMSLSPEHNGQSLTVPLA